MRLAIALILFVPGFAAAQLTSDQKRDTLLLIGQFRDATSGGFRVDAKSDPGLRATLGALRTIDHLSTKSSGIAFPHEARKRDFIVSCYDASTGGFREPGQTPNVTITSVGIMAAVQAQVPESSFPKALEYLKSNAKTFEEVRMGAAALEALTKKPDWLGDWIKIADAQLNNDGTAGKGDGLARETASVAAMKLRLGYPIANKAKVIDAIVDGQRDDGGWGKSGAKTSDLESTYRVMRALTLLKESPKEMKKLNGFLSKCRNADGGYGVEPGKLPR